MSLKEQSSCRLDYGCVSVDRGYRALTLDGFNLPSNQGNCAENRAFWVDGSGSKDITAKLDGAFVTRC
jgi:hypothetical protein